MGFIRFVFGVSLVVGFAALLLPDLGSLILLALTATLVSFLLLLRSLRKRPPTSPPRWIVVDGSNVMHWRDETARIETVIEVVEELTARGFSPGVVFDANAGYKLDGRFLDELALARLLNLPADRVHVVPKGTPADPFILRAARGLGAPIVTNDRYREWAEAHAEIREPGFLIRGRYRDGILMLAEVPAKRLVDAER